MLTQAEADLARWLARMETTWRGLFPPPPEGWEWAMCSLDHTPHPYAFSLCLVPTGQAASPEGVLLRIGTEAPWRFVPSTPVRNGRPRG